LHNVTSENKLEIFKHLIIFSFFEDLADVAGPCERSGALLSRVGGLQDCCHAGDH